MGGDIDIIHLFHINVTEKIRMEKNMKYYVTTAKKFLTMVLCGTLVMPVSATVTTKDTEYATDDVSAVLEKINTEYGTNIYVVSAEELSQYGIDSATSRSIESYETVDLEETLRYLVEVKIPEFERTTQEAIMVMQELGIDTLTASSSTIATDQVMFTSDEPIIATAEIDYAIAGAEAYLTENGYGNTVWGTILAGLCYSNMYQDIWFLAPNPTVTAIDGRRTLYWTGDGSYYAYINGVQYHLDDGTQYASMYAENYG